MSLTTPDNRRSLAMLNPEQSPGWSRDEAAKLVNELQRVDTELRRLRDGLRKLLEEEPDL
jgi:hypothetical protein